MIETNLPKLSWLSMANVSFLTGGFHDGSLGLSLMFSGKPLIQSECIDTIAKILEIPLPADKMIRVSGELPLDDPLFATFLDALHGYGYRINTLINETQVGTWLKEYFWVTIRTSSHLLMVQPNEIWYSPKGETWSDITIPTSQSKITFFYFDRTKSLEETEKFFCKSRFHWQLV